MTTNSSGNSEFISTAKAARQLGLSLGAVQQMVENGTLAGWKTAGGHRRIRQDSVDALLSSARTARAPSPRQGARNEQAALRVLVVEDDPLLQGLYSDTFAGWAMPLNVGLFQHALDALLEVGREPPDLLIADLRMAGLDGFEMIRRLRENPLAADVAIVVVTSLSAEEVAEAGGLPDDVTMYRKPIPFHELHGYMQALISQRVRQGTSAPARKP